MEIDAPAGSSVPTVRLAGRPETNLLLADDPGVLLREGSTEGEEEVSA